MMTNQEIAKILYQISEYLAMKDEPFKPRAYEKAALNIENLEDDVVEIYKRDGFKGLKNIPAVGQGIAERIEEFIKTGKIKYYQQLKKSAPVNLEELSAVESLGPKKVKKLYQDLGIRDLKSLEKAAKTGKIRNLENFGKKSEENILHGIEFLKQNKGRFVLGFILPSVRLIEERIKNVPGVKKAIIAGSMRRMKETIGDGDLLVSVQSPKTAKKVMDFFVSMPEVIHIYSHGPTRSSVRLSNGMEFDLRVVPEESFGAALQYFTGNKDHNVELRKIAIKHGWKLNEYGIYRRAKQIAGRNEEEVYKTLGLKWIEPELRENTGEIVAASRNELPELIGYKDLRGDLQIQTSRTDGANTIKEYVIEAIKMNLEYIVITDHTKSLAMTHGLDEAGLAKQGKEIDKINSKLKIINSKFRVLKGAEVNVLKDGKLDIKDEALKKLDIASIAVHSGFKMSKSEMTRRIIRAMINPNVDILFHPTGRVINQRPPYEVDIEKIIRAAKATKTILEIDAFPDRLDLKDDYIRLAKNSGVKLSIDSDAHTTSQMHYLEFGIAQARRGWAEKKDIINAWPLDKMMKMLK